MDDDRTHDPVSTQPVACNEPWASYSERPYRAFTMSQEEVRRVLRSDGPLSAAELTGLSGARRIEYSGIMSQRLEEFGAEAFLRGRHLFRQSFLAVTEGDEQQSA